MKIAVIYDGIPNKASGGGAFTVYSIIQELKRRGDIVSAVIISNASSELDKARLLLLRGLVDEVRLVQFSIKQKKFYQKFLDKFSWRVESLYPQFSVSEQVKEAIDNINPDTVIIYHFQALAAALKIKNKIKVALVGDPQSAVMKARFIYFLRYGSLKHWLLLPFLPLIFFKLKYFDRYLLNSCAVKGAFAYGHALELSRPGNLCNYFQTPLIDPSVDNYLSGKINKDKFKILLLGHLQGIVTLTGLELFAKEILPLLLDNIGKENMEVVIVGGFLDKVNPEVKRLLEQSGVLNYLGHQEDISGVMASADILVVPTPIKLGIRIRAITALGYGKVLVIHEANRFGMPELKDEANCLIGRTGSELADKIIKCYRGGYDLGIIKEQARATFEKFFYSKNAFDRIISTFKK